MTDTILFQNKSHESILRKVAENEGLNDISLEIETGSSKGDNYMGTVYRVVINGIKHGEPTKLNLILKTCANDSIREKIPMEEAYHRENFAYNTVFKELEKLQNEVIHNKCKFAFVKCHYTCNKYLEENLVMEDLKTQGFFMYDRLKSLDFAHASIAVENVAKLHALSYVLKAKNSELFHELASKCTELLFNGRFGKSLESFLIKSAKQVATVIEDPKHILKLEKFTKNLIENLKSTTRPGKYAVLCHGDCWVNNVLFKYQNGKPTEARLLDFQLLKYGSPATDLLYFIFSCTDSPFRKQYYYQLLDVYYNTLKECLRYHNLDINSIMTKEEFMQEMKDVSNFGLGMAIMTIRHFVSDAEDAPSLEQAFSSTDVNVTLPSGDGYKRYVNRANGIMNDFDYFSYWN